MEPDVRVGAALPGELAAWRYGSQIVKRQRNLYLGIGASVVAGGAVIAGLPILAGVGVPFGALQIAIQATSAVSQLRFRERVVLRLARDESPTGQPLVLRRKHLGNARLGRNEDQLTINVAEPLSDGRPWYQRVQPRSWHLEYGDRIELSGRHAEMIAARAMVDRNSRGASSSDVNAALQLLHDAGSADAYIAKVSKLGPTIVPPTRYPQADGSNFASLRSIAGTFRGERMPVRKFGKQDLYTFPLGRHDSLALEMALHDESERRAMEGELWILEDAWREAESIARIADALPDEPPPDDDLR